MGLKASLVLVHGRLTCFAPKPKKIVDSVHGHLIVLESANRHLARSWCREGLLVFGLDASLVIGAWTPKQICGSKNRYCFGELGPFVQPHAVQ